MDLQEQIERIGEATDLTNLNRYSEAIIKWQELLDEPSISPTGRYEIYWNYSICLSNLDAYKSALIYSIKAFLLVDTVSDALGGLLNPIEEKQAILDNIKELHTKSELDLGTTSFLADATLYTKGLVAKLENILHPTSEPVSSTFTPGKIVSERLQLKALNREDIQSHDTTLAATTSPTTSRKRAISEHSEITINSPAGKRRAISNSTFFAPKQPASEHVIEAPYAFWRKRLIIRRNTSGKICKILQAIPGNAQNPKNCLYAHLIKNENMSDEEVVREIFMSRVKNPAPEDRQVGSSSANLPKPGNL